MLRRHRAYIACILGAAALLSVSPAMAATVTPDDLGFAIGVIVKFKDHKAALQFVPTLLGRPRRRFSGFGPRLSLGDVTADTIDATASILDPENGIRSNPVEADFTVSGTGVDPISDTPLPAALPLFASGLGAFGLLSRRRKRKAKVWSARPDKQ